MPRRTDRLLIGMVLPLVLLLAGCAAMPDKGDIDEVPAAEHADEQNLQVRAFPVRPQSGMQPQDLLQNFLDATIGDEADYTTAKEYLTAAAARKWRPEARVAVLTDNPGMHSDPGGGNERDVAVTGTQMALLDANHTYSPVNSAFTATFTFQKVAGEWRIARLPDGLIVNQTNFRNVYERVNRYYFAAADPSRPSVQPPVLVPDPIYLRRRIDPLTAAAKALAAGPSRWLAPVVTSAFKGFKVLSDQVAPDDDKSVRVKVSADLRGRQDVCRQMGVQLLHTLTDQAATGVARVVVSGSSGKSSCEVSADQAQYSAGLVFYRTADSGSLHSLGSKSDNGMPVLGPLGAPQQQVRMGEVAVRRDGTAAAAVTLSGRSLYVVGLSTDAKLGPALVTSAGPNSAKRLTEPSWDGRGDLWVADRNPADPKVMMLRGTQSYPVRVDGLDGRIVQGLKVSLDGTRVALLLQDAQGERTVELGLVQHSGTHAAPQATITGLRNVAPQLTDVTAVSWAGSDQLVVLGKQPEGVKQPQLVGVDGSHSDEATLQAIDGMSTVAASWDPQAVIYADSKDHKIYRLESNGQWRVVTNGVAPVYPG